MTIARRLSSLLLLVAASASAAITGSVIDDDGKPIAGAKVRAFATEPSRPYRIRMIRRDFARQPLASATTRADGTFSVEPKEVAIDLVIEAPGRRMPIVATVDGENVGAIAAARLGPPIRVSADGKPVADAVVIIGHAVALRTDANGEVPNVSPDAAKLIQHPDFAPEAIGGGTTSATLTKGVALRGRVVNAKGPVAHATIMLDYYPFAETGEDGTFSSAHARDDWDEITAYASDEIGVVENGGGNDIVIRLGPALMASGVARDETGGPVAGAQMTLRPADGYSAGEMVVSDAKGNYAFGPAPRQPSTVSGSHPRFTIQAGNAAAVPNAAVMARPYARIEGRVVDEKGAPVAGATIFAPMVRERMITDANGRFSIGAPEVALAVSLQAQKQGYAIGFAPPRLWHFGDRIRDVEITLPRGFPLTVKVVDAQRKPLAGARVTLHRNDLDAFRSSAGSDDPGCPTCRPTNSEGAVTFRITEGDYSVRVSDDDGAKPDKVLSRVPLTARSSPLVIEMEDRSPAAPSSPTPAASGRVSGRVIDRATGRPLSSFALGMVMSGRMSPAYQVRTPDGTFVIEDLPSGTLTLRFTASGYAGATREVIVKAEQEGDPVEIALDRGGRVSGRVTSEGKPVMGGLARIIDPPPGTYIDSVPTGRDGRFVLDGVPPGEWTVSIMAGGYSTKRQRVLVKGEETTVEIALDRGLELRGRVVDRRGTGVTGANVSVTSTQEGSPKGNGRSGVDGWFTIAGLVPSRYRLLAQKSGMVSATMEIEVPEREPLTVTLAEGTTIYGRVSGVTAEEMATVRVVGFGSDTQSIAEVDSAGGFVIRGVPEGKVFVTGLLQRGDAERRVMREITVRPGIAPVEIDFGEGFAIRGRVTVAGVPLGLGDINFNEVWPGNAHTYGRILDGAYEVSLPKAGAYEIRINTEDGFRDTSSINVTSAVTKDIDIRGVDVRGRVVDANGAPVPGAGVNFVSSRIPASARVVKTDINGRFVLQALGSDPGTLTVRRDGYAPVSRAVVVPADAGGEMEVRLERGEEVRFVIVDAVSGQPVNRSLVEVDKMSINGGRASLSRGRHVAVVYANGYESQTVEFNVPVSEVRVALVKK